MEHEQHSPETPAVTSSKRFALSLDPEHLVLAAKVAFVVAVSFLVTATYHRFHSPRFVAVDLHQVVQKEIESFQARGYTDAERDAAGDRFNKALEQAIAEFSGSGNTIILTKPAVIDGVEDVTTDFQARVKALSERKP